MNQYQFNQMPVQKKSNPLKWIFLGGCAFSVICIALCGVVYYIGSKEIEKTEEAYGGDIIGLCNPIHTETIASDIKLSEEYPRQIVVFGEESRTRHSWHNDLPKAWQADNKDETDLVVCIREKEDIVEECEYTSVDDLDGDTIGTLQRVQYRAELFIFTAEGDLVDKIDALGSTPAECPDERRISGTQKEKGNKVTYAQFEDALRPIVEESAE